MKFSLNGSKGKAPVAQKNLVYGEKQFTVPKLDAQWSFAADTKYTFAGWNTKANGSGDFFEEEKLADLVATTNKQALTLYAVWDYDLSVFMGEGTENKVFTGIHYNEVIPTVELESDLPELAKAGYYIVGWATSESNAVKGKTAYTTAVKNAAGKVLYPVYKPVKYTVIFEKNVPEGAKVTGKMSSISATYGKSFTLKANAFKCSGYTFIGWSRDKNASEAEFANKQKVEENLSFTNTEKVTLYAIWEKK